MPGKLGVLPHLPRLCGADSRSSPVMPFYFDFCRRKPALPSGLASLLSSCDVCLVLPLPQ